jgi:hypothetical protein
MQIYYYSKCGIGLYGFNPHLPFDDHFLGTFFFLQAQEFFSFSIINIIDEGIQKSNLIFNSDLKGVC